MIEVHYMPLPFVIFIFPSNSPVAVSQDIGTLPLPEKNE